MSELENKPITRRRSLQLLLGFSVVSTVGGIVGPIVSYLTPQTGTVTGGGSVDVGKIEDFPVGSGTVVSVNDKPVIIVNTKAGGLKAFSAICTHLGCIVAWEARKNVVQCPCHEGVFNATTGAVVSGPPPKPLAAYELVVKDGKVLIGKPLGQVYGA
ncbi:MAG: ubiquinol-cytochrome c reductase iron-sulfur subunit [Rudaea sp.]